MSRISRVLCATDFSPSSARALELASSIAERYGASIDLVHVWAPAAIAALDVAIVPSARDVAALVQASQARLDAAVDALAKPHPVVRAHLIEGNPVEEILAFARSHRCDLIVLGTHGRTGLARMVVGSVAENVVRSASVPVMTTTAS